MTRKTAIIGAGCAGLSLARYGAQAGLASHIITDKPVESRADHLWSFWATSWLSEAAITAKAKWHKWQICDHDHIITHHSDHHPYHGLMASDWLSSCVDTIQQAGGQIERADVHIKTDSLYFDSRPPQVPQGCLLQHFIGQHIKIDKPLFAADTAILMDFRTDQSQGLHFIYLLPFSDTEALVESTLFTPHILADDYYRTAIKTYLATIFNCHDFTITHEEKGAIPLADLTPAKDSYEQNIIPIGAASGALRPSSGYGFAFIQRQAKDIAAQLAHNKIPAPKPPHRRVDLWMDRVFLSVLETNTRKSPDLFMKMAAALTGDEFATFMSGIARPKTYLKVILAMPKWIFIKAALLSLTKGRS